MRFSHFRNSGKFILGLVSKNSSSRLDGIAIIILRSFHIYFTSELLIVALLINSFRWLHWTGFIFRILIRIRSTVLSLCKSMKIAYEQWSHPTNNDMLKEKSVKSVAYKLCYNAAIYRILNMIVVRLIPLVISLVINSQSQNRNSKFHSFQNSSYLA